MILIAARSQSAPELLDPDVSRKVRAAQPLGELQHTAIAFIGFSTWRREENGDANLYDEQVLLVRDGRVQFLEPRLDCANFSPDGLSWGYAGSAPSQLAVAMLMEVFGDWNRVNPIWATFCERFIRRLPKERNWTADGGDIYQLALELEGQADRRK